MSSGSRREASGETRQEDSILDRLLRQMGIDTGSQRDGERTGESYLREWRRKLGDCWSRTAVRIERHLTRTPYLQFNLEGIHKDGLLWAECRTEDTCQRYRVRIGFPQNDRIPMACSCRRAEDGSICVHQLGLLNCVQDALASSFSRLSKLLLNQHFAEEVPESRLFKFDERQYFLDLLEGLPIDVTADELESEANCSELDLPNEITETRIAWRLKIDPDDCEIRPILQQAKKRGNGFTKGRPLGLDNLRAHLDAMTDRDRQVVDSMQVPFGYHHYRAAPELDACHCMTLLIGADNIYLDDQPVELVFFAPLVVYESDDKHCWLALAGSTENDTLHLSENHLVRCQPDSGRVEIAKLERVQVHLLQTILYLPKAPIDLHEELLSRLPAVSKVISCRIPESNAGAVVQDRCTTVVLIRSRADGSIDYGLRIRDLTGSLRIAGQGLCVRHTELDGAKIQLHRQVDQEISLVSSLADKLGVTRGATDGSIQDFDAALQFLDRLQSLESAGVDVLWDKTSEKPVRVLGTVTPKNLSVGITQKRDWFQPITRLPRCAGAAPSGSSLGTFCKAGRRTALASSRHWR